MSKVVKGAVAILVVLLVVSVGVAVFTLLGKQTLEQQNQNLQTQISDLQAKADQVLAKSKKLEKDQKDLSDRFAQTTKEKQDLQAQYDDLKGKADDAATQITQLNDQLTKTNQERDDLKGRAETMRKERDDWKGRMETIRKERDDLAQKLKNQPEKIVEKIVYKEPEKKEEVAPPTTDSVYWSQVLKQKTKLELDLQKAKADMDQAVLQVGELKKQNADMAAELKNLTDAKVDTEKKIQDNQQEADRRLKYSEELSNSLSLEVARARNDQKTADDRVEKVKTDNAALQEQLRQLRSTKLALEKTIAQINKEKAQQQKKLDETEGLIQGRIQEIWQIKQNLDQKISDLPLKPSAGGEVDLPPIIVNAGNETPNMGQGSGQAAQQGGDKATGTIISINNDNNFVIVDLGEAAGSKVGRRLTAYRGNAPIADLEVIQVRKDIAAADIKNASAQLKIGDTVRY